MDMAAHRIWKIFAFLGILAGLVLLWSPAGHVIFSARLALSMQKLASGQSGQDLGIIETKVCRRNGTLAYEALLYRPAGSPATSAIILAAGISELGCYHPRLMALSRFLADRGLLVITPDIQAFRDFQISAEPIDQILFWYDQATTLEGSDDIKNIGLAGISYSGTLALMAAARPEIRDRVGFAIGIGSYCSLIRCTRDWFATGSLTAGNDYYPTRCYAKWIAMRAALDMVSAPEDRLFLNLVLDDLLLQKKIPQAGLDLTPEGLRWYKLAIMRAGQSDAELAQKIEEHLVSRKYARLDPEASLARLHCPVFLIHGSYDDLIPASESMELHRRIANSRLLISPFLTHTHPTNARLSLRQKARAILETLVFCYQFSRAVR
jgi:pimeloyl-ACP methyl ester carboxylesterase